MKKIICALAGLFLAWHLNAQKMTVKGILTDSLSKPLESATVMLLSAKDSSLATFDRSNEQGFFELKNIDKNDYLLRITYVGLQNFERKILQTEGTLIDLGNVQMKTFSKELSEIVIEGEKSPVTIKKDTIEFNAGSFKTQPNATVEDLLKKLPGVQVERDGNIRVQGENVRRVTVDGKDFFGRDPKLATRNLPANAIESIQMFDRKSEQTAFSGIDDGFREKTINLKLKEKNKKGFFGNIMAGYGSDKRFQTKSSLNRFDKKTQLSFLGMGNNVNQQGFDISEYMNFTGGMQRMMSGGGAIRMQFDGNNSNGVPMNFGGQNYGFMKNWAAGINLNHQVSSKTEINGSYFFNQLDQDLERDLNRKNFLPGNNFTFDQKSFQNNVNNNHRLGLTLEQKIDSSNSIRFSSNLSYNETSVSVFSLNQTLDENEALRNEGERLNTSSGDNLLLNSSILFRHKFRKKGRTMSANLTLEVNQNEADGILRAFNTYYDLSTVTDNFDQINRQKNSLLGYGMNVSYTEPLGKRRYLEWNYTYRHNRNEVNRRVFDMSNGEGIFNDRLSNEFINDYDYHRAGMNFRLNRRKYNFSTGLHLQNSTLDGEFILSQSSIRRNFTNLLPNLRFNYVFSNTSHLNLNYETSVQEPNITQLQPIVDNTDPLNIYEGNPDLRPAFSNRLNFNFVTFDAIKFTSFFLMSDLMYTTNFITQSQTIDDQFVRTTRPVNVQDNLNFFANMSFGFPVKKLKSRFNVGTELRYNQGINLLNNVENYIRQSILGGNIRYDFNLNDIFDLSLGAEMSYQETKYSFSEIQNQFFLNQTYTAETYIHLPLSFLVNGTLDYQLLRSQTTGFAQNIPMLSLSLARLFLKNKSGELKFTAFNVLNQALGASQTAQVNFLEQSTIRSLGRYYMVSFTYNLNKALNFANNRSGMMRIIRR